MSFRPIYTIVFFALFLLLGLAVLDDFGISWDESIQRRHGRVTLDYAAEKLGVDGYVPLEPSWRLDDYQWANYGMVYQLTANLLERWLGYEDSPYHYYRLRHLLCFGLFWLASIFFYRCLRWRFPRRGWYPLLGTLLLVLSPRIFANAFYNPKDHILLVFYLIASVTLLRFLGNRSWGNLLLHAFATGLALNTRLPALIIPLTTVLVLGWGALREPSGRRRNLKQLAAYLPLAVLFMLPFFPYLWEDTLPRLAAAFTEMSAFEWDSYVLLFGDRLSALDLPAYYIPAWILITTPIVYLFFLFAGLYASGRNVLGSLHQFRFWRSREELFDFVQLGLALGPILVVIVLGSTLYNGWRHLHFVYPAMVYLMVVGYDWARTRVRGKDEKSGGRWHSALRRAPSILLVAGLLVSAMQMVRYHPHQYVYFNAAIHGEPLNLRFDLDYWGVGFRDAFMRLAEQVPEGEVRSVKCDAVWPCKDNYHALPPAAKAKLRLEGAWHRADYLATNFIWDNTRYAVRDRKDHFAHPVVEIRPAGDLTVGIYDLRPTRPAE